MGVHETVHTMGRRSSISPIRPRRLWGSLRMVTAQQNGQAMGVHHYLSGSSAAAAGHPADVQVLDSIRCRGKPDAQNPGPAELGPRIIRRVPSPDLCADEGSIWSEKSARNWRSAMRAEALRRDVHMACAG